MSFGVVSGVGREMGGGRGRGRSSFGDKYGHPIVTNGEFDA